jgi:hypothetical protein
MQAWRKLFRKAAAMLDASGIPSDEWTFGGGTALMLYFRHRESKDVDVFFTDAQYLTVLTPRLNAAVSRETDDYVESSNFLKLRFSEGEIDFVIAPHLTKNYCEVKQVEGKKVRVETPEEIVIKKLFYGTETLKVRDVIDVAVVFERRKDNLLRHAGIVAPKLETLRRRWDRLGKIYSSEAGRLKVLEKNLVREAPVLFGAFLQELEKLRGGVCLTDIPCGVFQKKRGPKI